MTGKKVAKQTDKLFHVHATLMVVDAAGAGYKRELIRLVWALNEEAASEKFGAYISKMAQETSRSIIIEGMDVSEAIA